MHTIKLNIQYNVFDKVIYFLNNLPSNEIKIVADTLINDWSHLKVEIDKRTTCGINEKSHEEKIELLLLNPYMSVTCKDKSELSISRVYNASVGYINKFNQEIK